MEEEITWETKAAATTNAKRMSGYVAFPCGTTIGDDGDSLNLYDERADTRVALATGTITHLPEMGRRTGTCE